MKKNSILIFFFLCFIVEMLSAQSGMHLFDDSKLHTIKIYFDQAFFWDTLSQRYIESIDKGPLPVSALGNNQALQAKYVMIDGERVDSVGIKQRGYSSNWGIGNNVKKPLKISFNEFVNTKKFDGLKDINLANGYKDPTMLHDALSYRMMRESGIDAPRTSFANVYINDSLWGLYIVVEQVNEPFLQDHFGNTKGNLYKVIESDLKDLGRDTGQYALSFEKKSNVKKNDWSDIVQLSQKINHTSYFVYHDTMPQYIDMKGFLMTLAIDVSLNNWDSYFDHGRNFYLYHNPTDDRFHWIPWDYNLAFSPQNYPIMLSDVRDRKPLIKKCFNDPVLKQMYLEDLCSLHTNIFTLASQGAYIDSMVHLISPSLLNDNNYVYSFPSFMKSIYGGILDTIESSDEGNETLFTYGLKAYFIRKNQFIQKELNNEFMDCKTGSGIFLDQNNEASEMMYYINKTQSELYFLGDLPRKNIRFINIYNAAGVLVFNDFIKDEKIDISCLSNGTYTIQFVNGIELYRSPLYIQP